MSGIIRIQKSDNYTHVSNIPANNKELSWEARGVLFYLLTKPNGWQCRNQDLINKGPAGGDKVERILDELQAHGYITRKRVRGRAGLFDWETTIYEAPIEIDEATKERLRLKRERQVKKRTGKSEPTIGVLSTDGSSTDGLSTNGSSTSGKPPHILITESIITESVINKIESAAENRRPPTSLAFKVFVEETKKTCLNLQQIKIINETVGTDPAALEKWREAVRAWNMEGNKLTNAAGMLEWFKSGKRSNYEPNKYRNGNGAPDPLPPKPVSLDAAKRAAYLALQAEHEQATIESQQRVGEIVAGGITVAGLDVARAVRRNGKRGPND